MKALFLLLLAIVSTSSAHAQGDLQSCMVRAGADTASCRNSCGTQSDRAVAQMRGRAQGPGGAARADDEFMAARNKCLRECDDRNSFAEDRCLAQEDRRRRIEQEQEDRRRRMEQNTPRPSDAESFNGPGSNQDFAVARYQCFRETQQIAISASRDALGSSTSAGVQPSCAMFNACLAAKGYERVASGRFTVSPDLAVKCSR